MGFKRSTRNGAGKTTLIRVICGLQSPTRGSYSLYGINGAGGAIAKARRRMGAVVETPAIYTGLSARDNLKQQYRVLGLPSFDRIDELLELVGLSDSGEKKGGGLLARYAPAAGHCHSALRKPRFSRAGRAYKRA